MFRTLARIMIRSGWTGCRRLPSPARAHTALKNPYFVNSHISSADFIGRPKYLTCPAKASTAAHSCWTDLTTGRRQQRSSACSSKRSLEPMCEAPRSCLNRNHELDAAKIEAYDLRCHVPRR